MSEPLLKGKKVMWVEDDKFLSDIIARRLSTEGCLLIHQKDGNNALAIAEKEQPDIILLDILLPGFDGFEILSQVKENPKTKHIPVMMLSNMGQKSDIERGQKLGASRFLVKATVTLDEIIADMLTVMGEKK